MPSHWSKFQLCSALQFQLLQSQLITNQSLIKPSQRQRTTDAPFFNSTKRIFYSQTSVHYKKKNYVKFSWWHSGQEGGNIPLFWLKDTVHHLLDKLLILGSRSGTEGTTLGKSHSGGPESIRGCRCATEEWDFSNSLTHEYIIPSDALNGTLWENFKCYGSTEQRTWTVFSSPCTRNNSSSPWT